jgi:D-alanyl-D-alanine carboxypeptidase
VITRYICGVCPVNQRKEKTVFKLFSKTIILIVLIALTAGCGPAAPTETPVPTAPPVPQPPTVAPAPLTDTLVPLAATPALPTRTPAPSVGLPTTAAPTAVPATRTAVATATPVSDAAVEQLIDTIADLGTTGPFAGAVLIAKDGAPLYMAAYGLASRSPDVPNQTDTIFNLGSMNKMFTAVAILQLVEQGRLSLDGRISDYYPDYPNQEVARKVTIHHLLVHTSGMGDCFEGEFFTTPKDQLRTVEGYLPLFVDDGLQFEAGTRFAYSNEGYIVLGSIIEKVTGQSYWDYVRENVYRPSGMSHTGAYELDTEVPNRAIGYTTQDAQGNETGTLADNTHLMPIKGTPAGGGYSTVEDLLNFSNALRGDRLLSPESTELLLAGKVEVTEGSQYAYGFFDMMVGGQRVVGHGGGAPGVCTSMEMYLDSGYTVIVLSNTDQGCYPVLELLRQHPFEPSL